MAAMISSYQPCRSHLAQPARCFEEPDHQPASLNLRRRQFIERCHDVQIPHREARRREEPKNAPQTPVRRQLNVDSGWSKVEEVRKKFEGAAPVSSFSRSFESPPRRRLADSLFASFKLPRKKEGMWTPRAMPQQQKRKSAVEMLAESKAFYVKSETVLDSKQELPLRMSSGLGQAIAAGGCHLVSSGMLNNDVSCNPYATTSRNMGGCRRAVSAGEGLQNTLRRLLQHSDDVPPYAGHKIYAEPRRLKECYQERELPRSQHNSGTFSGTSSSGTSGSKAQRSDPDQRDKSTRPLSFGDARVFFPESFVIPRQRPTEIHLKATFSIRRDNLSSSQSSPEQPDVIVSGSGSSRDLVSPPAQYAHSAPRYTRSNSHSQPSMREDDENTNINSHKSLPDLHTEVRCYTDQTNPCTETIGRSPRRRRHSTHQRTASCSSKGTRSNHSSLMSCDAFSEHPSPGDENYQSYNSRCGSSFARDSGGSSGHYTQRSAPPHPHSGASTHHGANQRYYKYVEEVVVCAPAQFQDGAPSPPTQTKQHNIHARVGIHFQASAPPPQFSDDPATYEYQQYDSYTPTHKCPPRNDYTSRERERDYNNYRESTEIPLVQRYSRTDEHQEYVNTQQICSPEEVTSPLGTFKRQRCLRYKQRKPRPILRSKSDISDRYRRPSPPPPSPRLQQFFSQLGLEPRQYTALVDDQPEDSPVFFSSASTVDSNPRQTVDYTVQGPAGGAPPPTYRNLEPPSVVERNARIIKWLCQCRKIQMLQPQ